MNQSSRKRKTLTDDDNDGAAWKENHQGYKYSMEQEWAHESVHGKCIQ